MMTRESALRRIGHLLAKVKLGSGCTEEERRTASTLACEMMIEHGILPASGMSPSPDPGDPFGIQAKVREIDYEMRIDALQRELATVRAELAAERERLAAINAMWARRAESIHEDHRLEERAAIKRAVRKTTIKERESFASKGGEARAKKVSAERLSEIGRKAAQGRWGRLRK